MSNQQPDGIQEVGREIDTLLRTRPPDLRGRFRKLLTASSTTTSRDTLDKLLSAHLFDPDPEVRDEALYQLMELYATLVKRWVSSRYGAQDGDDRYQETWLRVQRNLYHFQGGRLFRPWLRKIVYHSFCDEWRQLETRQEEQLAGERAEQLAHHTPEREVWTEGRPCDRRQLAWLLAQLEPPERQLVELRGLAGWTYRRLADHFGILPQAPLSTRICDVRRWWLSVQEKIRRIWQARKSPSLCAKAAGPSEARGS